MAGKSEHEQVDELLKDAPKSVDIRSGAAQPLSECTSPLSSTDDKKLQQQEHTTSNAPPDAPGAMPPLEKSPSSTENAAWRAFKSVTGIKSPTGGTGVAQDV